MSSFKVLCRALFCATLLTALSGCIFDLSPDGTEVVMQSEALLVQGESPRPSSDLAIISRDKKIRTISNSAGGFNPVWSPDGRYIVFAQERDDDPNHDSENAKAYILDRHSNQRVSLAVLSQRPAFSWRSDGKRLVALERTGRNLTVSWFDSKTGKRVRRVLIHHSGVLETDTRIRWLGSNNQTDDVIFVTPGAGDIYRTQREKIQQLTTTHDVIAFHLTVDHQIIWLRYPHSRSSEDKALRTLQMWERQLNSSRVRRLSFAPTIPVPDAVRYSDFIPVSAFSPDGRSLAVVEVFPSAPDQSGQTRQSVELWLMNRDGSRARRIHRCSPERTPVEWEMRREPGFSIILPVWSRQGESIVFAVFDRSLQSPFSIWRYNVNEATLLRIR